MSDTSMNGRKQGWLAWLLLIPVLIAAAVVGFFVFVVILGLVLLAAAVLLARLWWLRRKMRNAGANQTLEGEYVVVRTPARDGGSAEREAVPAETNAGKTRPQRVGRDKDLH
jgi:Flp pilus assembly protein TadB